MPEDMPITADELAALQAAGLGDLGARLLQRIERDRQEIDWRDVKLEKLTFEMAQLKRMKFGKRSEQLDAEQKALFDEAVDADIAATEDRLEELLAGKTPPKVPGERPKREALPAGLPRVERRHEPENTMCACGCALKRIGEDVSEKLDYTPGVFTVERHIRGKWACSQCRTLTQAPVPAEIIDKGIPTAGLLAQVLVAKYADHLPLYRQEAIFGRAGHALPRSTLGAWIGVCGLRLQPLVDALKAHVLSCAVVHADETPVAMLAPGNGKTHRAYLWAYAAGAFESLRAVVYDFTETRAGEHARAFLGDWRGSLVCDDYTGYKASFALGVTEAARGQQEHHRRHGHRLHRTALWHRTRDQGACPRAATPRTTNAGRADCSGAARLAHRAAHPDHERHRHGQGDRLQPQALGRAHALPGRPCLADRQQPRRAADPAVGDRAQELAVRRDVDGGPARRGHHELDPVGQAQWA